MTSAMTSSNAPASTAADPLLAWRDRFPILDKTTYLCSHSLGPVPSATEDALREYYREWNEKGIVAWDGPWWDAIGVFGRQIEQIIGAPAGTVAPMLNVTRALEGITSCFEYTGKRNRIVTTALEFITTVPFLAGLERIGAELVVVPSDDGVTVSPEAIADAIDDRTRLVVCSHTYFRSAALQDLKAVAAAAHKHGAYLVGDCYQTAGVVPIDVVDMNVDFLVGGAHKWLCGGPGAGFLYVKKDLIPTLKPRFRGWFGLEEPFAYTPGDITQSFNPGVLRFLCGTANVPGLYAAREGLNIINEIGVDAIAQKNRRQTQWMLDEADRRGYTSPTPRDPLKRTGMICLNFDGAQQACDALIEQGVIVDFRPDCGIRVSPHFFTTDDELVRFFDTLDEVRLT